MRLGLLLAVLAVTVLPTACGSAPDESATDSTDSAGGSPPSLVVASTTGGQIVEFTDFSVTCRNNEHAEPSANIVTALAGFGDDAGQPRRPKGPAMIIEAADSVVDGTTVKLPYSDERMFVGVFITEVGDEREIASNTELSTGEIEVVSASCEPIPRLEVRIDGVMESELSGGTVTVQGYVAAG